MKNRKTFCLILSLVLVLGVALPGTLATAISTDDTNSTFSVGTDENTDQNVDTPLDDVNTDTSLASSEGNTEATEATPAASETPTEAEVSNEDTTEATTEATTETTETTEEATAATEEAVNIQDDSLSVVGERVLTDGVVTVEGNIPNDVELVVEDYSTVSFFAMRSRSADEVQQPLARLNITLYNPDGSEWQPEVGESVTVTLNAAELGLEDGHDYVVSHIHEDEVNGETVTDFCAIPYGGEMTFDLPGFSYILVFEGQANHTLGDINAFYPASLGGSGNGHYQFLGLYYDSNGDTHFLLATVDKTPPDVMNWFVEFYIDGQRFVVDYSSGNVTPTTLTYSSVQFKDESGQVLETVQITEKGGIASGFFDVNIGKVNVDRQFQFVVSSKKNDMPTQSNGWNINDTVTVDLDYNLAKQVAKGTSGNAAFSDSVTVERGDWVIYKITLNNIGSMPLSGMVVTDILPDALDATTAMMGIGDEIGNIANWEPYNSTLIQSYSSPGQFSRNFYIKAQVKTDLNIVTATDYTNTAEMSGTNMPSVSDSAVITVNPPRTGTLTVSKTVTSENPMDPAPDDNFTFTIHSVAENSGPFTYTVGGTSYSVANGGTFTLKNAQSAIFEDFPVGTFTVTEINADGYSTKTNGTEGKTFSGSMPPNGSPVVAFENQFSTRNTTLSITKTVEKAYTNDILPDDDSFTFQVSINGESVPDTYAYTINGEAGNYTLTNNGTISLKAGQTATIQGIPVGAGYTVTEVLGELAAHYDLTSVTGGSRNETSASGTLGLDGAALTFTNTYKRHLADLTITKSGWKEIDENQSFVFRVQGIVDTGTEGIDITVVICKNGSTTIKDLPIGAYVVTEETSWSWRYTPNEKSQHVTVDGGNATKQVEFSNTRAASTIANTIWKWLNGCAYNKNVFVSTSSDAG